MKTRAAYVYTWRDAKRFLHMRPPHIAGSWGTACSTEGPNSSCYRVRVRVRDRTARTCTVRSSPRRASSSQRARRVGRGLLPMHHVEHFHPKRGHFPVSVFLRLRSRPTKSLCGKGETTILPWVTKKCFKKLRLHMYLLMDSSCIGELFELEFKL